jgi:hypothetical protein
LLGQLLDERAVHDAGRRLDEELIAGRRIGRRSGRLRHLGSRRFDERLHERSIHDARRLFLLVVVIRRV